MNQRIEQIRRLERAERYIAVDRERISRQRDNVIQFEREGVDHRSARHFLSSLLEIQAAHENWRKAIIDEIE
jgi:hypothetical protein